MLCTCECHKNRTIRQNSSLHMYFQMIEEEARNSGATMDMLIKNPTEVPVTATLLKDMFRLIGKTIYGKDSTAKLTKKEMSNVIEVFEKIIAERLGISIPYPSIDFLLDKNND